jgi:small subunit ribosomal protein S21
VRVEVINGDINRALRALKKKLSRNGIIREMRRREAFEKPSERRFRRKREARDRAKRQARWAAMRERQAQEPGGAAQ